MDLPWAWLAAQSTTRAIQQEQGRSFADDKNIYDALIGYAATHPSWAGVDSLVARQARKLGRRITLMTGDRQIIVESGDMHDMPFQSGVFDVVFSSNVLEHAFAPYCALMDARRVLKPGGIGYFVLPSFEGDEGGVGPFHLHCLSQPVWMQLLHKTGFVVADALVQPSLTPASMKDYTHYRCVAVTPPHPHDRILSELTTYKATPHD